MVDVDQPVDESPGTHPITMAERGSAMSQRQSGTNEPATAGRAQTNPTTPPSAYGYLRTEESNEELISTCRMALADFCRAHGRRLVTVFCDRGSDGSEIARPGFAALLDVLALPEATAVLVPDLDHLSPHEDVRNVLVHMVKRVGAGVVVTDGTATQGSACVSDVRAQPHAPRPS
jgi:resolvase-like protein